jgi:hypothetical protein
MKADLPINHISDLSSEEHLGISRAPRGAEAADGPQYGDHDG